MTESKVAKKATKARKASRKTKAKEAETEETKAAEPKVAKKSSRAKKADAESEETNAAEPKVAKKSSRAKKADGGSGNTLVVVESPAKAKTIKKYLGARYTVKASVGHIMDLPKSKIGVDVENGFEPVYEVIKGKVKVVAELKAAAKNAQMILIATDPDREGDAIALHVREQFKRTKVPSQRVLFTEITKKAIQEAI
ncbi:MAG: toprim domain-containing protein, partial [Myxococcales bacterium]